MTPHNISRLAAPLHPACHTPFLEWPTPSPCSFSPSSKESQGEVSLLLTALAAPVQCCPYMTEARDNMSLVSPASHTVSTPAWNRGRFRKNSDPQFPQELSGTHMKRWRSVLGFASPPQCLCFLPWLWQALAHHHCSGLDLQGLPTKTHGGIGCLCLLGLTKKRGMLPNNSHISSVPR